MHIQDNMLQGAICPTTAAISTIGVAVAAFLAIRSGRKPTIGRFAAITALIFAGQMMNFPVQGGTSGHLMGGVLASALMGTPFGVLSIALIVVVQALLFSDGGLTALGANIFNMALVGAGLGGVVLSKVSRCFGSKGAGFALSIGLASWLSLAAASFVCSVELAFSGVLPFADVTRDMFGIHAIIGLGEALITIAAFYALKPSEENASQHFALGSAAVIAILLSPFASSLPDGLEWVAEKQGLMADSVSVFAGPLKDYSLNAFGSSSLSTSLAGFVGVSVTFFIALAAGRLSAARKSNRSSR